VGATTVENTWDGLGHLVARTSGEDTTVFLYGEPDAPWLVTATRAPDGTWSELFYDPWGALFAVDVGGTWYYVGSDQVGTPRVVVDATGQVVEVVDRDAFGRVLSDSNAAFSLPVGFAGGLEDPDTGLVRFLKRDYDPVAATFLARDPLLFTSGEVNLYAYAMGDPVGKRDPGGTACYSAGVYVIWGGGAEMCCDDGGRTCVMCFENGLGLGLGSSFNPLGSPATPDEYYTKFSMGCDVNGVGVISEGKWRRILCDGTRLVTVDEYTDKLNLGGWEFTWEGNSIGSSFSGMPEFEPGASCSISLVQGGCIQIF